MPRDLTKAEQLQEEIRCHRGMIATWEERSSEARMTKLVAEQQAVIDRAKARIGEVEQQYLEAPAKVKEYEARLEKARTSLKLETNKHGVAKLEKTMTQVQKMLAEVEALRVSDPEAYAALVAQMGGTVPGL